MQILAVVFWWPEETSLTMHFYESYFRQANQCATTFTKTQRQSRFGNPSRLVSMLHLVIHQYDFSLSFAMQH